jgi:hypothetical protein
MKARADLRHVAEGLAASARAAVDVASDTQDDTQAHQTCLAASQYAEGARAALEAAALVDVDPAPIIAGIEALTTRLGLAGLDQVLIAEGPGEALQATADMIEHYQREVAVGAAVQHGYIALRALLEGLERDFNAGGSEISLRIAARIHAGLEDAENAIKEAKQGGTT